jgi:hypothetical protein
LIFTFFYYWTIKQTDGSTIEVKPIFYQLSMIYELIFIFFYYQTIKWTDGSTIEVKSIFLNFPWWIICPFFYCRTRMQISGSVMGVTPIFISFPGAGYVRQAQAIASSTWLRDRI